MYNIWMRNYPQADVNMTEETGIPSFKTLKYANDFIKHMEKEYEKEDWQGHRMYKAKFYAEEVK